MSYLNRKFTWDFDSLKVFFLNYVLSPLLSLVGYYECATAASQAAKTVTASWYNKIREGGSLKIKFTHKNTAASGVTLKIGSAAAKPLFYEGAPVDATHTWDDGETVEVYYDGTSYYANNVKGGSGDGAFDVSVNYPTSGVGGGNTYTLDGALAVLDANLSANKKKGGMSIKFIQSSDNKYVQFRYMSDDAETVATFTNVGNWAICDNSVLVENYEFIEVKTDNEGKILWAIKADGSVYFGAGVPQQVKDYIQQSNYVSKEDGKGLINTDYADSIESIDNKDYLTTVTDNESKILEGVKRDGTKEFNTNVECNGDVAVKGNIISSVNNSNYIEAKISSDNRLIEGITSNGEKHIGQFDEETKKIIKSIAGSSNPIIEIPQLDTKFTSPVPVVITGTKGDENAKYEFELPLSEGAFNIRFKFRITENLLNQEKSAVIAKLGGTSIVAASVIKLQQYTSNETYNDTTKTNYWASLKGGVNLNSSNLDRNVSQGYNQNIGDFALSILYTGEETDVTIENDGTKIILSVNEVSTEFPFSTYQSVYELFNALSSMQDFEVGFGGIEGHLCSELAVFSAVKLVSTFYTGTDGTRDSVVEEYVDSSKFFIPYAVDSKWHQVEIVKSGTVLRVAVDGYVTVKSVIGNNLTLGGECGVLFKDVEVCCTSVRDAEIIDNKIISSVNPYIIFFEGHGMLDVPTESVSATSINQSPDRYKVLFNYLEKKGYIPISIQDAVNYYLGIKSLPKRCYTIIFDDYRFENCMDIKYRSAFTKYGVKPTLAVITGRTSTETIEHNGTTISEDVAAMICRINGFDLVSHTVNHTNLNAVKPSTIESLLTNILYDADIKNVDGKVLVYPFGRCPIYLQDVANWLGFTMGIYVDYANGYNVKMTNRFEIKRIDTGNTVTLSDIINLIY